MKKFFSLSYLWDRSSEELTPVPLVRWGRGTLSQKPFWIRKPKILNSTLEPEQLSQQPSCDDETYLKLIAMISSAGFPFQISSAYETCDASTSDRPRWVSR